VMPVLPASPLTVAHADPVRSKIAGPGKTGAVDEGFNHA
jgi:hypothetical protein